jgi:hypothetical protein
MYRIIEIYRKYMHLSIFKTTHDLESFEIKIE